MRLKRVLPVVLALVLVLSLAACASDAPAPVAPPSASSPAQATSPAAVPQDITPTARHWPLVDSPFTFNLFAQISGATVEDIETNSFTAWYEEQTGVKIDWNVVTSGAGDIITLMIASGDLPDAFLGNINNTLLQVMAADGIAVPLTNSIYNYGPNIVKMLDPMLFGEHSNLSTMLRGFDIFIGCEMVQN